MSNVPPPIRNQSGQPNPSSLVLYVWLITALIGLCIIAGVIASIIAVRTSMKSGAENENPEVPVYPLLPRNKNLSKIVKHNPDGWFEVEIADFPLRLNLPGRPSRTPGSRSFMPEEGWTSDYTAYQVNAQGIAVSVTGCWLNETGRQHFEIPDNLDEHASAAAGSRGVRINVNRSLQMATARSYRLQNGPITNHVAMVKFMQRPDLMVGILVSARTLPEAKAKLDKVIANLKINEDVK